jgi:hypothetical protein
MLVESGSPCERVISVDADSILWVATDGVPHTTWLAYRWESLHVCDVSGFQAEPPVGWGAPAGTSELANRRSPQPAA